MGSELVLLLAASWGSVSGLRAIGCRVLGVIIRCRVIGVMIGCRVIGVIIECRISGWLRAA